MAERGTGKITGWELPESIYWSAIRKKLEAEQRDREAVREYHRHVRDETKDGQITFRIARADIAKLKKLAHSKNKRYQAYLRDILKREVRMELQLEEQRAAAAPRKADKGTANRRGI